MNTNTNNYIHYLEDNIYRVISINVNIDNIDQIVEKDIYSSHVLEPKSAKFQKYYFSTVNNEQYYYSSSEFFRVFKKQYSLQGIDNSFLDQLEHDKWEILNLIHTDKLSDLYFNVFRKAKVKYKATYKEKDLASFFTKLVHTFRPSDYCALDNPIKEYFKLSKESFFISFFIISSAYKNWASNNNKLLGEIKDKLKLFDKFEVIKQDKLTDLKLLDLIFWSKANRK
jgi:hypothetical protein